MPPDRDLAMINEVYNRRIIELAGTIPRIGRLAEPDATAKAVSRLCGSTVTVDLKMDGDRVSDFAHEVKACALGQASSSIMASHVVGSNADELRALRETVRKMLKESRRAKASGRTSQCSSRCVTTRPATPRRF
jgi:NifU-like protein involved in Fe-S cluster formation